MVNLESLKSVRAQKAPPQVITSFQSSGGIGLMEPMQQDSSCRFCEEEDETAYHIVAECPRLLHKRWECFKEPFLEEEPVWHPGSLLKFLRKAKIGEMNKRESSADSQN